jgi:DNA-binding protein HU-beta
MNKQELIRQIATTSGKTQKEVADNLDLILSTITKVVANGDKVTLVGFGTFQTKNRAERKGRNPQNGKEMIIPATKSPHFSAGKDFRDLVKL